MVANQVMGNSVATGKGLISIVQGGGSDYLDYCTIRKLKVATQPGEFVTTAGESAGNPLALADEGDQVTGTTELCLYRVGAIPQDIDTEIAANSYGMLLRENGKRFKCAAWRIDTSAALLRGQKLTLEANDLGILAAWAYTDTVESSDSHVFLAELAEDSADVASLHPVVFIYF